MPNGWGPMGLSNSQLDTTLAKIMAKANEIGADANVLRRTMVPYSTPGQPDTGASVPLTLQSILSLQKMMTVVPAAFIWAPQPYIVKSAHDGAISHVQQ